MNKLGNAVKHTFSQIHMEEFFVSLFFGIVAMMWMNPLAAERVTINSFDRKIGPGIVQNSDVAKIVSNFNKWFFILVLVWLVFYMALSLIREKGQKSEEVWSYILRWLPFAYITLILKCFHFFSTQLGEKDGRDFFACNLAALLLLVILIYYLAEGQKLLPFSFVERSLVASLSCAIPAAILFDKSGALWNMACVMFLAIFIILCGCFYFAGRKMKQEKAAIFGNVIVILMTLFPTITFIYIEAINVLNQYEIFINRPFLWYVVGSICYVVMIAAVCLITIWKFNGKNLDWKRFAYPFTIMGIQFMGIQFALSAEYTQDLMESANYGVMISNFLTAGRLPVVESYGGHQLEGVLEGLLYAFINQDYAGAVFSPYTALRNVVIILFLYFVLKNIFDRETAFLFTLIVPFWGNVYYWGIGLLVVLAFKKFLNKQSYGNITFLWLACVFSVLYRLDLGYSFTIAMILTMICYFLMEKKWKMVKKVLLPLLGIGIAGLTLWIVLCLIKDINPVKRLIEFLNISFSNHVWGRASLGNESTMMYVVAYIFLPVLVIFSLIYMILKQKELRKDAENAYYLCIMLGFAYMANFSRGLVRHSMLENVTFVAYWCAFLYFAVWLAFCRKKPAMVGIYFVILATFNQMLLGQDIYAERPVISAAAIAENNIVVSWKQEENNYWGLLQEKVQRTEWSEQLKESALPLETVCELFLDEGETYVDLMNKDFIYAVLLRESPMYMCQTPLMVSGDYTQEALVQQIQDADCPIVLLPSTSATDFEVQTDLIANNVRNYKIVEYVYQNYRPLLCYQDTIVWCRMDQYEEFYDIALSYINSASSDDTGYVPMELVDYGYDAGLDNAGEIAYYPYLHSYNLVDLAMLWGNYDKQKAYENSVLQTPQINDEKIFIFDPIAEADKKEGNYLLLQMKAPSDEGIVYVELGTYEENGFHEKYEYIYRSNKDIHQYLIRISGDYYWYAEDISAIRVRDGEGNLLENVELNILMGD